jgi:hypothetical protein
MGSGRGPQRARRAAAPARPPRAGGPGLAVRLLLLAFPLAFFLPNLFQPIHGAHIFRQTHVAANIEHFVRDGVFTRPALYNHDEPRAYFDTPIYQAIVASLSAATGADPVLLGRLVNVLVFVAGFFVLDRILARLAVAPFVRACTLAFTVLAPVTVYFGDAILPDPLAVALAFGSLLALLEWERAPRVAPWVAMVATGVLATLIKNPVYLPVAVTILAWIAWHRGPRALLRPEWLGYVVAIGVTVVGYAVLTARANHPAGVPADEWRWYFGSGAARLSAAPYLEIAKSLRDEVLNPVLAALALIGVVAAFRHAGDRAARAVLVLVAACVVTMLVFFNLHYEHDYYQLPFAFPLALAAAFGLDRLRAAARARWRLGRGWDVALIAVLLLVSLRHTLGWYQRLSSTSAAPVMAAGAWLRTQTDPADFVVFVHRSENLSWNPAYLYFAKREGYNLVASRISRPALDDVTRRFGAHYERLFVFAPAFAGAEPVRALDALGLPVAAEGPAGRLYRLAD